MKRGGVARVALAITATEFRRVVRDRMGLFFIIVLPVAIIVVVGVVFGSTPTAITVAVVDDGDGAAFVDSLEGVGTLDVSQVNGVDELERRIRTGEVMVGLIVRGSHPVEVEIRAQPGSEAAALVKPALQVAAAQLDRGGPVDFTPTAVEVTSVGEKSVIDDNRYAFTAPANLVLFVFVNSVTAGVAMVEARRSGVTRRMLTAPIAASTVIIGNGINRFAFALLQSVLIVAIGSVAFGVRWGQPLGAVVLVIVWSMVGAAAGLMVGAFSRTPEQVNAIGIPVSLGMAMLGGCLWPLAMVGSTMRIIGHATPHAWAMDSWMTLVFDGGGISEIVPNLVILTGIAVVMFTAATLKLRRVLIV